MLQSVDKVYAFLLQGDYDTLKTVENLCIIVI